MRLFAASLVLVGLSAPVMAQDRGTFALDAMTTPGRHFGFGYYITDALSIRPSLGFGYASGYGAMLNLGADMRYEVLQDRRVSPYLTASFNYLRDPSYVQYGSNGSLSSDPNLARYGAGVGVRTRIVQRLSLVGEGRVMNAAFQEAPGSSFSGQESIQHGAHFEAAIGVSYFFN